MGVEQPSIAHSSEVAAAKAVRDALYRMEDDGAGVLDLAFRRKVAGAELQRQGDGSVAVEGKEKLREQRALPTRTRALDWVCGTWP